MMNSMEISNMFTLYTLLMKIENYKEKLDEEFKAVFEGRENLRHIYCKDLNLIGDIDTFSPINFYRLIPIIVEDFNIKSYSLSDITPIYVMEKVQELFREITKA